MTAVEGRHWDAPRPLRLTLTPELGHDIDGAWWLRTGTIARELPTLVATLKDRLGEIIDIKVNWSVDGPPNLSFYGGQCKRQPVMTVRGRDARANILIVPWRTATALAVLVLRQAAFLPVDRVHLGTDVFKTAECIVDAARNQRALLRMSGPPKIAGSIVSRPLSSNLKAHSSRREGNHE